jgi:uncharacterized membrane protein YvbJ
VGVVDFKKRKGSLEPPEPPTVECPKCGSPVDMYALRCRQCGVHFAGPAFQFGRPIEEPRRKDRRFLPWMILWAGLVLLVILLAALAGW